MAAELATHAEQGRDFGRAVGYHYQAAAKAARLSAHRVAADHATRGLDLLNRVGNAPDREARELDLLMILGLQLQTGRGFAAPGVQEAYARARELCGRMRTGPELGPILLGLWAFYAVRAANRTALEVAEQLLEVGEKLHDSAALPWAYNALGIIRLFRGDLAASRTHLEQAAALYAPDQHCGLIAPNNQDPKVTCLAFGSNGLWLLGETDRAGHEPGGGRLGPAVGARIQPGAGPVLRRHPPPAVRPTGSQRRVPEELLRLADEHGFTFWSAGGTVLRGRAAAEQGRWWKGSPTCTGGCPRGVPPGPSSIRHIIWPSWPTARRGGAFPRRACRGRRGHESGPHDRGTVLRGGTLPYQGRTAPETSGMPRGRGLRHESNPDAAVGVFVFPQGDHPRPPTGASSGAAGGEECELFGGQARLRSCRAIRKTNGALHLR